MSRVPWNIAQVAHKGGKAVVEKKGREWMSIIGKKGRKKQLSNKAKI